MKKISFLFFLIIVSMGGTLSYAQDISTVAGGSTAGYSGDGGAATSAELQGPYSVAVDDSGNIYIADTYNSRVRKVSAATGIITTVAGDSTAGYDTSAVVRADTAKLYFPTGVAVDHTGNVYIADAFNSRVRKVTAATGLITTVAGNGTFAYNSDGVKADTAALNAPAAVFVDDTGNIFIVDAGNSLIRKVTVATGIISTVAGNTSMPPGYSGDGGAATAAQLSDPQGVYVDGSGNIYIADEYNNRIRKVTAATGFISTIAGDGTGAYNGDSIAATTAELSYPTGVSLDIAGNIYIADQKNNRIRKIDAATGLISTVAGTGNPGYNGDGIAPDSAELNNPIGLTISNTGNMYIADLQNSRIREFTLPCSGASTGTIHTAGATTACNSTNDTLSLPDASIGAGLSYQWQSSTTGTSWTSAGTAATYNTGTITTTTYFRAVLTCATGSVSDTSAVDTITIHTSVTPSVTISVSPGTSISAGETATFTATVTNGGSAPIYQWKKNNVGIVGGINATYSTSDIADGDIFTCVVNSSATCAIPDTVISNGETMHVTPSGVAQIAAAAGFTLFPDPNDGTFTIESTGGNVTDVKLSVSNVTGQVVYAAAVAATGGKLHQVISLPAGLAPGVYTVSIKSGTGNINQRFIKNK